MKLDELTAATTANLADMIYALQSTGEAKVTLQQIADLIGSQLADVATSGSFTDLTDAPVASHVADADATSLATVAASVDALRDALVTAGLMAGS